MLLSFHRNVFVWNAEYTWNDKTVKSQIKKREEKYVNNSLSMIQYSFEYWASYYITVTWLDSLGATTFLFVRLILPSKLEKEWTMAGTQLVWTLGNSRLLVEKMEKNGERHATYSAPLESSNHLLPLFRRRLRTLCGLFPPSEKGFRPQVCRKNLQVPVWLVRSPLPNLATSGTRLGNFFALNTTPVPAIFTLALA